jgi:hypothetical protein
MPVYILESEMPYDEFCKWELYFNERPVGWRDDQRIYKVLQAIGIKAKPEAIFESLMQLSASINSRSEEQDANKRMTASLGKSVIFSKLLSAKGGDTPDFLKQL